MKIQKLSSTLFFGGGEGGGGDIKRARQLPKPLCAGGWKVPRGFNYDL